MFVDASAIIAIIADEPDRLSLSARLAQAREIYVSPFVVYEATTGLARQRACSIEDAEKLVALFVDEARASMIDITVGIAREAARTFGRFGRGKHKASLNMGDCFAYACARERDLSLLFKGNDFVYTDIEVA
ncbi:type II toxin-antitoxin system VapC family toxin [Methylocapsa sp. S129]|uniref:type II toxin-antitoxin system VapC family toxin n=1 Tax=Methylocapsa sp. S129 TaxID=1641869 RepID=UPI00131D7A85|nr:type II toxin-antitoxin system VapC family toxin [Methylocapsa sp. S129]